MMPAIRRRSEVTLVRSIIAVALAAMSVSIHAQTSYPSKHQKETVPAAQPSGEQRPVAPEEDQTRRSKQFPSEHSNEAVRDRDTKKKASERADERERNPEGQTIPEPRK